MWNIWGAPLWRSAYRRSVRSAFATVPIYRERWALSGRTDPVLVPGKTGRDGGAIPVDELAHKIVDAVPLAGGSPEPDPGRGLGPVLPAARPDVRGGLVVLADERITRVPPDLPPGTRGCVLDPREIDVDEPPYVLRHIADALRHNGSVVVVGPEKAIAAVAAAVPEAGGCGLAPVPHRALDGVDGGPYGVLHDPLLGYLGALGQCGRLHLDWRRVYARSTSGGLAFTLLRTPSPRFVDVLIGGGVHGEVGRCPRHGTPVVLT